MKYEIHTSPAGELNWTKHPTIINNKLHAYQIWEKLLNSLKEELPADGFLLTSPRQKMYYKISLSGFVKPILYDAAEYSRLLKQNNDESIPLPTIAFA